MFNNNSNNNNNYGRWSLPVIFGSAQLSAILGTLTSCVKCCVTKLRKVAETWLRRPRKKTEHWRDSQHNNNLNMFVL